MYNDCKSSFYIPFQKYVKSDSLMKSHVLMIRSGMIRQHVNGIYSILPLGVKVLNKIIFIIKKNLSKINANEVICPTVQSVDIWKESGRYEKYEKEILHCYDKKKKKLLYAPTAEDIMTKLMYQDVKSTKQLPLNLYQTQWKFRDEIRPRFGLMRSREFLMMDAYTFSKDTDCSLKFYKKYFSCFLEIFKELGVSALVATAENGDVGGEFSHEFYIESDSGESKIDCKNGLIDENFKNYLKKDHKEYDNFRSSWPWLFTKTDKVKTGIEVGHIFYVGNEILKNIDLKIKDKNNSFIYPQFSSYGIGVTRLLASLIEVFSSKDRIEWPDTIRPFEVCLISASEENEYLAEESYKIKNKIESYGVSAFVINDSSSINEKIEKANLIGVNYYAIFGNEFVKNKSINFVRISDGKVFENFDISRIKELIDKSYVA